MGRGNSSLRYLRLGLLVMVILAGVVFHHSGGVYDTIHAIYYVLIVGFIVFAIATRRRAKQSSGGTAGGSWGGGASGGSWGGGAPGGSWGNTPPPAQPPASGDPSTGPVNNEHDPAPNDQQSDPPTS
jgi:hypothetical protein